MNTEQKEINEIILKLEDFAKKYKELKDIFLDLLKKPIAKKNLDLNETIHIQLYSIKKIIDTLEEYIKLLENIANNPDKESTENVMTTFDKKFMKNMNNLYKKVMIELQSLKKKFRTN